MATSFNGGISRREPPTMGKQLVKVDILMMTVKVTGNI
jgi:hypothetical protein